jgi:hypothetical protein
MDLGVVAFWLAVAAVLIAGGWFKSRSEAQKHATLRAIIEKNGTADEAQVRALFGPPSAQPVPGDFFALLRVIGTIVMCTAVGLLIFFAIYRQAVNLQDGTIGLAAAFIVGGVGVGFLLASRWVDPRRAAATQGQPS